MNKLRALIKKFIADRKRNDIEEKYKCLFMLMDLDYYGYLELQRMKNRELSKLKTS